MKKFLLSLVLVCLMPLSAFALTCPNKPSGANILATIHFDTNDGEGQLWDLYPGAGTITTSPGSEGNVSASILPVGAGTGGQQVIWPKPGNQQPLNNMYSCFRWKMNAQFVGIREGNKLFFQAAQDWTYGKQGMNGVFYVNKRTSNYPDQNFQLLFSHNSGNLDNSHACPFDLGLGCPPNVSDINIVPDVWYTIETYIIASTCTTCRNATVRWWIDGQLMGNFTNLNYGDGIVNQWQINHTWDGAEGKRCGPPTDPSNPRGRDCTNPQIHYFDEAIIASSSGVAPTQDTIAPTQVGGVAIGTIMASSIALSWNAANDNVGIAGYNIDMCTGQACTSYAAKHSTTGIGTAVTITGLSPATPYSFRIKARDATGNVSAQYSTPVSATTAVPSATLTRNTLATDNFNRADNSDLGAAWSPGYATGTGTIVSNAVRSSLADSDEFDEVYNAVSPGQDQWAQATLSTWPANATLRYGWLMVRAAGPPTVTWYQCTVARNDGSFSVAIEKKVAGVQTVLASNNTEIWSAGDVVLCEATGTNPTTINLYRNGTLVLTATDTTSPLSGGQAGLGAYMVAPTTTMGFDDFSVGDFVGLTLPRITNAVTDATGADLTWTSGPASIRVNYDGGQTIVPIASVPGGRYSFVWPVGTTFACFFAVDSQGNVNTNPADYICRTVTPSTADITPPAVSSPTPSGALAAGTTSTTIGVVTSESAVCKYALAAGTTYAAMPNTMTTGANNVQHSAVVTGLTNNTAFVYYVKCADTSGNITVADTLVSFSVNAAATDVIAPTAPSALVGNVLNANQVQLVFTPSTDAVGVAGYQVYACVTLSCITFDLAANGSGSPIIVNGLQPNTLYSFKVRAFDAVLNLSGFSAVVDVRTPVLDTLAPSKMVNLVATRTGYDSFSLSWDPGTDDNQVAGAAIDICVGDGCNVFKLQYIVTGRTSITINGLASQLPYYFRGKHIDTAGNVSEEYSDLAKGEPFPLQSGTVQGVCACQIP